MSKDSKTSLCSVFATKEQIKKWLDCLDGVTDEGPDGEGWKSEELLELIEALKKSVRQDCELDLAVQLVPQLVARAEQACRYAVKHQDFSESSGDYSTGFRVGAEVCEGAIALHVNRHLESILAEAIPTSSAGSKA